MRKPTKISLGGLLFLTVALPVSSTETEKERFDPKRLFVKFRGSGGRLARVLETWSLTELGEYISSFSKTIYPSKLRESLAKLKEEVGDFPFVVPGVTPSHAEVLIAEELSSDGLKLFKNSYYPYRWIFDKLVEVSDEDASLFFICSLEGKNEEGGRFRIYNRIASLVGEIENFLANVEQLAIPSEAGDDGKIFSENLSKFRTKLGEFKQFSQPKPLAEYKDAGKKLLEEIDEILGKLIELSAKFEELLRKGGEKISVTDSKSIAERKKTVLQYWGWGEVRYELNRIRNWYFAEPVKLEKVIDSAEAILAAIDNYSPVERPSDFWSERPVWATTVALSSVISLVMYLFNSQWGKMVLKGTKREYVSVGPKCERENEIYYRLTTLAYEKVDNETIRALTEVEKTISSYALVYKTLKRVYDFVDDIADNGKIRLWLGELAKSVNFSGTPLLWIDETYGRIQNKIGIPERVLHFRKKLESKGHKRYLFARKLWSSFGLLLEYEPLPTGLTVLDKTTDDYSHDYLQIGLYLTAVTLVDAMYKIYGPTVEFDYEMYRTKLSLALDGYRLKKSKRSVFDLICSLLGKKREEHIELSFPKKIMVEEVKHSIPLLFPDMNKDKSEA